MSQEMLLDLIRNVALLIALAVSLQMLTRRIEKRSVYYGVSSGLLFGTACIIGMMTPLRWVPGVIYDGRSIVLSLAGLFGGPITAAVAVVVSGAYRAYLGGAGMVAGVLTIIESAVLGTILYYLRRRGEVWVGWARLWLFGVLVHVIMLALQLLLPGRTGWDVLSTIGISILTFYPLAFLLTAQMFLDGERKQLADEALRESEEQHRTIIHTAMDGFCLVDMKGRLLQVNESYCRMSGYSEEELMTMNISDLEAGETPNGTSARIKKIMTEGKDRFESRHRRKGGGVYEVEVTAQYQPFGGGQLVSFIRDITERKVAEEELRRTNNLIDMIVENIPNMIFVKDARDLRFVRFNRAGEILLGHSRNELLGKSDHDFFPREQADFFTEKDREVLRGRSVVDIREESLLSRGKGMRILHTKKVPILDVNGEPEYLLGISEDITERKQADDERRKLEERLQRAEKMEALGTLAGGVAHDLNNVLGIVVGYSELLVGDLDKTSPARSKAVQILKGGQRAAAIVQDLLTLARRGVPNRRVLNLNKVILECQKSPEFANVLSAHPNIQVKTDFEPDVLNVLGSSVHLEKSFMNLVSNAAEAMPGGGTLTVKTARCYLDRPISGYDEVRVGDYVVLAVSDTGEGMAASDLMRIFEPFYTKKVMGKSGTGLGLAVVWGTVKDHQGYINVESQEGKGTTFTLYFPVTRDEINAEEISVSAAEYLGRGEFILVVDDVKEQRELATTMLQKLNYVVESFSSGEEAVQYLKQNAVDLVVLDMIMDPGMDGLDAYRKMLEVAPHQKAIIVSGFAETERVREAQALGAGPYVKKPYVLEKLGLAVRKELNRVA